MVSKELKKIIERINNKKEKSIYKEPATLKDIEKFEKENRISFPKQFKEWLSFSDGADLILPCGIQFYGIKDKPIIDINNDDRPSNEYVVIGAFGFGDPIVFKNGEEKISIYNHEAGVIEDDETYDDFYAFLNDLNNILGLED